MNVAPEEASFPKLFDEAGRADLRGDAIEGRVIAASLRRETNELNRLVLQNAQVIGPVDLAYIDRPINITFESCSFGDDLDLSEASVRSVVVSNCDLNVFNARGLRTASMFKLTQCTIEDG